MRNLLFGIFISIWLLGFGYAGTVYGAAKEWVRIEQRWACAVQVNGREYHLRSVRDLTATYESDDGVFAVVECEPLP